MNHPRLRFLALGVILTLAAACGSSTGTAAPAGESPATSAAPAASEPAASGPAGSPAAAGAIPEQGVDDGSTITMWSRAATETRVQSQVDEYNATHQNKVELRLVPTDEYVSVVGTAATANELPDLFSADVVFMPNWTSQGLFMDLTERIDGLPGYRERRRGAHRRVVVGRQEVRPAVHHRPLGVDVQQGPVHTGRTRSGSRADEPRGVRRRRPRRPGARTSTAHTAPTSVANCGGCNVFTWWPIIWADGGDVMNADGTEALAQRGRRQGDLQHLQCAVGRGRHQPRISAGSRSHLDPAVPRGQGWHHADAGQPPGERRHAARQPRRDCDRRRERR